MQWFIVQDDWADYKTPIQQQWDRLTEAHLDGIAGQEPVLIKTIQTLYHITRFQAKIQLTQWLYSQTPKYTQHVLILSDAEQATS